MTEENQNLFEKGEEFLKKGNYLDAFQCFLKLREAKLDLIRTYSVEGEVRKVRLCDVDSNSIEEIGVLSKQKKFYIFSSDHEQPLLIHPSNDIPCQSFCFLDSGKLNLKKVVLAEQQNSLKMYDIETLPRKDKGKKLTLKFVREIPRTPEIKEDTIVLDMVFKKNYIFVSTTQQTIYQYNVVDGRLMATHRLPQSLKRLFTGGKGAEEDYRLLGIFENGKLALFEFGDRPYRGTDSSGTYPTLNQTVFELIHDSAETTFLDAFIMDIDNDGAPEIVACSQNGRVIVYSRDSFEIKYQYSFFDQLYSVFCADIDEDGNVEILVGAKSNYIYVLGLNHEKELTVKWQYKTPHQVWALRIRKSAKGDELLAGLANGKIQVYRIVKLREIERKVTETYNRLKEQWSQLIQSSDEPAMIRYCLETSLGPNSSIEQAIKMVKAVYGTIKRTQQYELAVQILSKIHSLFAKHPNDDRLLKYTKYFLTKLAKLHLEGTIYEQLDDHLHGIVRDNPDEELRKLSRRFEKKLRATKTHELNKMAMVNKFIYERQYPKARQKLQELSHAKIDLLHILPVSEEGGILKIYPGQPDQVALAINDRTVRLVNIRRWTTETDHFGLEELPYYYHCLDHSIYKHLIAQSRRIGLFGQSCRPSQEGSLAEKQTLYERPIQCAELLINQGSNVSWIVALRNGKVLLGDLSQPQPEIVGEVSTYIVQMIKQEIQGQINLYLLTLNGNIYALEDLLNPQLNHSLSLPVLDLGEYVNVIDFLALDHEQFLLISDDRFYVIRREAKGKFKLSDPQNLHKNIVCATILREPSPQLMVGTQQKDLWLVPLEEGTQEQTSIHLPYVPTALYPLENHELLVGFENGILHHYRLLDSAQIKARKEECDKATITLFESEWQTHNFREKLILLALAKKGPLPLAGIHSALDAKINTLLLPQECLEETLKTLEQRNVIQIDAKESEQRYSLILDKQYSDWIGGQSEFEIVTKHREDILDRIQLADIARIINTLDKGGIKWWQERLSISTHKWQDLVKLSQLFSKKGEVAKELLDLLCTKVQGRVNPKSTGTYPTFELAIPFIKFQGFDQIMVVVTHQVGIDTNLLLKDIKKEDMPKIVLIISEERKDLFKTAVFNTAILNQQDLKKIFLADSPRQEFLNRLVVQVNLVALSPFQIAGPVSEMFYGRHNERQQILAALLNPNARNFAVIGPRRIGKTSLLKKIQEEISVQAKFQSIFLDAMPYTIYEWYQTILTRLNITEKCDNPRKFIDSIRNYCSRHPKQTLVLFIDEIDNILQHHAKDETDIFPRILRALIGETNLKVVIAGYNTLYFQMGNDKSALFNMLEPIELSSLDDQSARELIEEPLKEIYSLDESAIPYILEKTGGYPNFIQFCCRQLVQTTDKGHRAISKEQIDKVTNSPEFFDHVIKRYLQNLDDKSEQVLYLMVYHSGIFVRECSENSIRNYQLGDTFTPSTIHRLLELYEVNLSKSELDTIFKRLVLACAIKRKEREREGQKYTFVLSNLPSILKEHVELEVITSNLSEKTREIFSEKPNHESTK